MVKSNQLSYLTIHYNTFKRYFYYTSSDLLLNAHSLINMEVGPLKAFQEALSETPGFLTDEPFYPINFLYKNYTKETSSDCWTAMGLYQSAKAKYPEEAYIVTQYIHTLRKHLINYASLSKLPPKNMDLFLLNAAFAVTQGKTILTDVVKKAVEYRDILRDILQSQINNKEPMVLRVLMRSENLEDLLSQASFLILQGKATLNNALITAAGQQFMPALRTKLHWCMHHNVNDFAKLTTLSEREKESLLLHASTLIVEDYYEVSEALNKARGQKHVPELRKVLDYHIGKKVPRFTSLSPEKKEALLLNAGFLVVIGKATLDTDALIKALKL